MLAAGFFEWLADLDTGVVRIAVIVIPICLLGVAWSFAAAWRAIRQTEYRSRLAAMMLERGMKSDEIERVVRAAGLPDDPASRVNEAQRLADADPEVRLARALTDNHYEGTDVEQILAAARESGPIDDAGIRLIEVMAENWSETSEMVSVLRNRAARRAPTNHEAAHPADPALARG